MPRLIKMLAYHLKRALPVPLLTTLLASLFRLNSPTCTGAEVQQKASLN